MRKIPRYKIDADRLCDAMLSDGRSLRRLSADAGLAVNYCSQAVAKLRENPDSDLSTNALFALLEELKLRPTDVLRPVR